MKYNTVAGEIELISFDKFLKTITMVTKEDDAMIEDGAMIEFDSNVGQEDIYTSNYVRKMAPIIDGDLKTVAKTALLYQSSQAHKFYTTLDELIEGMVVDHMNEFGLTTHLVKVGKRMWMPANPEDFRIYKTDKGYALTCFALVRTVVYRINTITQKQADDLTKAFLEKKNEKN